MYSLRAGGVSATGRIDQHHHRMVSSSLQLVSDGPARILVEHRGKIPSY